MTTELQALVSRLLLTLTEGADDFGPRLSIADLPAPPHLPSLPSLLLESETGLSLGAPPARSLSLAIPAMGLDVSCAWVVGEDRFAELARKGGGCDWLQLLLVEVAEPPTRAVMSRLASQRSLVARIPGYVAHSFQSETSASVHRDLVTAGLAPRHLAHALVAQARDEGFSGHVCVAVGVPSPAGLARCLPFADDLLRLRAALSPSARRGGEALGWCGAADCRHCDERDVCDRVRAVLRAEADYSARGAQ